MIVRKSRFDVRGVLQPYWNKDCMFTFFFPQGRIVKTESLLCLIFLCLVWSMSFWQICPSCVCVSTSIARKSVPAVQCIYVTKRNNGAERAKMVNELLMSARDPAKAIDYLQALNWLIGSSPECFFMNKGAEDVGCISELVALLRTIEDQTSKTALHYAIEERKPENVHLLLDVGFDSSFPQHNMPLFSAIWQRTHDQKSTAIAADNQIIEYLLAAGAPVDDASLIESVRSGLQYTTQTLLDRKPAQQILNGALHVAVNNGSQEYVKMLFDAGARTTKKSLIESVRRGNHAITQMILARTQDLAMLNRSNVLRKAVQNEDQKHVQILLGAGAQVDGYSLLESVNNKTHAITQLLLAAKPEVNELTVPLANATYHNDIAHIKMLLEAGADPSGGSSLPAWESAIRQKDTTAALLFLAKSAPSGKKFHICFHDGCERTIKQYAKKHNPLVYELIQQRELVDQVVQQNRRKLIWATYTRDEKGQPIPKYPKEIIACIAGYLCSPAQEWQHFLKKPKKVQDQLIVTYEHTIARPYLERLLSRWELFWLRHKTLRIFTPCGIAHLLVSSVRALCFWLD